MTVEPISCGIAGLYGTSATAGASSTTFFLREDLLAKNNAAAIKVNPATAPTTIPAIAPLPNPLEPELSSLVSGVDPDAEACEDEVCVIVVDEDDAVMDELELMLDEI